MYVYVCVCIYMYICVCMCVCVRVCVCVCVCWEGGFPGGSAGKESACNVRDLDLTPGLGRSCENHYPLQYLEEFPGLYSPWGHKESDMAEWLSLHFHMCVCVLVAQSCLTLCNPTDCSLPGSFVHGLSHARTLEWVAISFPRGSSQPRDQTCVSCIARGFFTIWAAREAYIYNWLTWL